jgi:multicomponent Na+:H+ antiporter subunit E
MIPAIFLLMLIWVALARSFDPFGLVIGLLVSIAVILAQRLLFPSADPFVRGFLRRPHQALLFLAILAGRVAASTVYTSRLILFGREEGRVVALPIRVSRPIAQFLLLNAITLTPSTISLLVEGDLLYIHWLRAKNEEGDWQAIKESLERRLLALFPGGDDEKR